MAKPRATKAGPATPVAIVPTVEYEPSPYEQALTKAEEPGMLVKDNPLMKDDNDSPTGVAARIQDINMDRLHKDRRLRRQPNGNGSVYAGFMANRFGG